MSVHFYIILSLAALVVLSMSIPGHLLILSSHYFLSFSIGRLRCLSVVVFRQQFQTTSPLKPPGQSSPNFICSLQRSGEKSCSNGSCHITNMAASLIYGKTPKKFLFQNKYTDDIESWYKASCMQLHLRLFKL